MQAECRFVGEHWGCEKPFSISLCHSKWSGVDVVDLIINIQYCPWKGHQWSSPGSNHNATAKWMYSVCYSRCLTSTAKPY